MTGKKNNEKKKHLGEVHKEIFTKGRTHSPPWKSHGGGGNPTKKGGRGGKGGQKKKQFGVAENTSTNNQLGRGGGLIKGKKKAR